MTFTTTIRGEDGSELEITQNSTDSLFYCIQTLAIMMMHTENFTGLLEDIIREAQYSNRPIEVIQL